MTKVFTTAAIIEAEAMVSFTRQYDKGLHPNERFGQAFCNYFNHSCSELFHEKDRKAAEEFIWNCLIS